MPLLKNNPRQIHAGGNGYIEHDGLASFVTTAATYELPCPVANVQSIDITIVGVPASDEVISVDEAGQISGGILKRPASGTLTIRRTGASKTSGLVFSYRIRGY